MSNHLNAKRTGLSAHRRWLSGLAIGIIVPTLVLAATAMEVKSSLYWILGGQTLIVSVHELGATDEVSLVTIEIRDAANVIRASTVNRNLSLGKPVILSTTIPAGGIEQRGARVRVTIPDTSEFHQPSVSMEVFDPRSLTIKTLPPCAIPLDQMPSGTGGAEGNCDGWHLSARTAGD
jgi:hypothetical protein